MLPFPQRKMNLPHTACTQSVPRVQKSTCCFCWELSSCLQESWEISLVIWSVTPFTVAFFPLKIPSFTAAGIPNYNILGRWMLWSARSLMKHAFPSSSDDLLFHYSYRCWEWYSEFLSQTGLDLGITGISAPQPQNRKTWYRTCNYRNHTIVHLQLLTWKDL